jgi:hypothetical protein
MARCGGVLLSAACRYYCVTTKELHEKVNLRVAGTELWRWFDGVSRSTMDYAVPRVQSEPRGRNLAGILGTGKSTSPLHRCERGAENGSVRPWGSHRPRCRYSETSAFPFCSSAGTFRSSRLLEQWAPSGGVAADRAAEPGGRADEVLGRSRDSFPFPLGQGRMAGPPPHSPTTGYPPHRATLMQ